MIDYENDNAMSEKTAASLDWNVRDDLKGKSLEEINKIQPKFPYAICLLNTTGSLNVGVALRSAVLFGAEKFYIVGKRRYDKRSTVGAQNYIHVERMDALRDDGTLESEKILDRLVNDGYSPIMIETDGSDMETTLDHINWEAKPCFILGEEKAGIPEDMLSYDWPKLTIPTYGVLRSLNVSVAASIVMYEVSKYHDY